MDFPSLELVKLAPRDLTGPGVEFYARRTSAVFATQSGSFQLPADQLSPERLYMLTWAFRIIPGISTPVQARWYLQLPTIDILLWAWGGPGYVGTGGLTEEGSTPFLVIPGGKAMLFVADFDLAAANNTIEGWVWGYSFPKGNVLSF